MKIVIAILLIFGSSCFSRGYDDVTNHQESSGWCLIIIGWVLNIIGILLLYKSKAGE